MRPSAAAAIAVARRERRRAAPRASADHAPSGCDPIERGRDALDVVPHVGEPSRRERHDRDVVAEHRARRRLDLGVRDRADVALVLRDDHVGPQRGEARDVDLVDAEPCGDERRTSRSIAALVARGRRASARVTAGSPRTNGGWSHSCETPTSDDPGAERAHDLGRARQQRDDAHGVNARSAAAAGARSWCRRSRRSASRRTRTCRPRAAPAAAASAPARRPCSAGRAAASPRGRGTDGGDRRRRLRTTACV